MTSGNYYAAAPKRGSGAGHSPADPRLSALSAGLVFLVSFLAYANTVRHGFAVDDRFHLVGNDAVRTIEGGFRSLLSPMFPGNLYRPLVTLSYAFTHAAFGLNPGPYHLTNVVLHAAASALGYLLLVRFFSPSAAVAAGLLFALNPIHVEAVANVSGRSELLATVFGLSTLLYVLGRTSPRAGRRTGFRSHAVVAVLYSAALLSKESALVYPLLLLLCLRQAEPDDEGLAAGMRLWTTTVLLAMGYVALRAAVLGPSNMMAGGTEPLDNPLVVLGGADRVFNAILLLGRYLLLIAAPTGLSADYSYAHVVPVGNPLRPLDITYLVVFLVVLVAGLRSAMNRGWIGFCVLWFLLSFAVTANVLFPIGTVFAERLAYLPSLGAIGLAAVLLDRFPTRVIRLGMTGIYAALLVVFTLIQNRFWAGDEVLWERQYSVSPKSARTLYNYGVVLMGRAEAAGAEAAAERDPQSRRSKERRAARFGADAVKLFDAALGIYGNYAEAHYAKATIFARKGDHGAAERSYKEALKVDPRFVRSLTGLGRLYLHLKKLPLSDKAFHDAYELEPRDFDAGLGVMQAALRNGDLERAEQLRRALTVRDAGNKELQALSKDLAAKVAAKPQGG